MPKEQIFGPIVMDRGCLRASRGMDEGSFRVWDGLQALVQLLPVPKLRPRAPRLCQMVPEGFYCIGGPHLPCVLQAPAVKVKHKPRRGGGRHACPHCLITFGPQAHVLCTSPRTAFHCSVQVHSTTHATWLSNRLATLVGDHAPTTLETFHRPLFPNIQTGQITSRMPQLQSSLGPLTPFDTRGLLCSPSLLTLR